MNKRIVISLIILIITTIFYNGCGLFDDFFDHKKRITPPPPTGPSWTLMIYLDADNSLGSPYGYDAADFNEMEQVGSRDYLNIIVQWDKADNKGTWRYRVTQDNDPYNVTSTPVQELPEQDMSNPATLKSFIQWSMQNYPAEHYALIIWDHGLGWKIQKVNRGFCEDLTGDIMTAAQLPEALNVDQKLDIVIFDACLMQMVEVAYQIKDYADILAGSEESVPGTGLPYHKVLQPLADNPNLTPQAYATILAQEYLAYYQPYYMGLTYSVADLSKMTNLATTINQFAAALNANLQTYQSEIRNARDNTQSYDEPAYRDIYHFAQLIKEAIPETARQSFPVRGSIKSKTAIPTSAQAVMDAVNSTIIYQGTAGQAADQVANSHGFAIYLPKYNGGFDSDYLELTFANDQPQWTYFLQNY